MDFSTTASSQKWAHRVRHEDDSPRHLNPVIPPGSAESAKRPPFKPRELPSFIRNFVDDDLQSLKLSIDLRAHAKESGVPVTNATVQELAAMIPNLTALNLSDCSDVTDVGLWSLSKSCTAIKELDLSGLMQVTHVGLRSVVIRSRDIERLNLSRCTLINDLAIRVVAASCWKLSHASFHACNAISDGGLLELAQCCRHLRYLDLSKCGRVSDNSLVEIGRYCTELRDLNLNQCTFLKSYGVSALANGCTKLESLRLAGCHGVDSAGVRALAASCPNLTRLDISSCRGINSEDLVVLSKHLTRLEELGLKKCNSVGFKGLAAVSKRCVQLRELNLTQCVKGVTEKTLATFGAYASRLETLNATKCTKVTQDGIRDLVLGCTRLTTLKVDGCKLVTSSFLQAAAVQLPFVKYATRWFGFEPLPDTAALISASEERRRQLHAATAIQSQWRACVVRHHYNEYKKEKRRQASATNIQRCVRGLFARLRVKRLRHLLLHEESALAIQCAYRGMVGRKRARKQRRWLEMQREHDIAAIIIQSKIRQYWAKVKLMRLIERERIRVAEELRMRKLRHKCAIQIQSAWRVSRAKAFMAAIKEEIKYQIELRKKQTAAARKMQRMWRGHTARQFAERLRAEWRRVLAEQRAAVVLQNAIRRKKAYQMIKVLRANKELLRRQAAASAIQRVYRGSRGRHIFALLRSLAHLRAVEEAAAARIQNVYKVHRAKSFMRALRAAEQERRALHAKAIEIQKVARGWLARIEAEVMRNQHAVDDLAAPIRADMKELEEARDLLRQELHDRRFRLENTEKRLNTWAAEYKVVLSVQDEFYDSDKVTGTLQRFHTKFLRKALRTQLRTLEKELEKRHEAVEDATYRMHDIERRLRGKQRDLAPLQADLRRSTLEDRRRRFRDRLKMEEKAAMLVQAVVRGRQVRRAIEAGANYWLELFDETNMVYYYYNTMTEVTRWTKPVDFEIYGTPSAVSASGWTTQFDEASNAYFYYNVRSGQYRWDKPKELVDDEKAAGTWDGVEATELRNEELDYQWWQEQDQGKLTERSDTVKDVGEHWQEMWDPSSGAVYYMHKETGETRWSLSPAAVAGGGAGGGSEEAEEGGATTGAEGSGSARGTARSASARGEPKPPAPPTTRPLYDRHWFDKQNHDALAADARVLQEFTENDWTYLQHKETGACFYYNFNTGESSWEQPLSVYRTSRYDEEWWRNADKKALAARSRVLRESVDDWQYVHDERSGLCFWWNPVSLESSWEAPPAVEADAVSKGSNAPVGGQYVPPPSPVRSSALSSARSRKGGDSVLGSSRRSLHSYEGEEKGGEMGATDAGMTLRTLDGEEKEGEDAAFSPSKTPYSGSYTYPRKQGSGEQSWAPSLDRSAREKGLSMILNKADDEDYKVPSAANVSAGWVPPLLKRKLIRMEGEPFPYKEREIQIGFIHKMIEEGEWLMASGMADKVIAAQRAARVESERKAQEEEAARVRAEMERIAQQEYDERIAMMWEDQHSREAKRYWLRVEAAARRKVEEAERAREAWERDLMEAEEDESTMYEAWMKVKAKEIADAKRAEERARQRAQERARQRKELMAMSIADEESTKENDQYKLIEEERRAAAELERQRMLQLQEELKQKEEEEEAAAAALARKDSKLQEYTEQRRSMRESLQSAVEEGATKEAEGAAQRQRPSQGSKKSDAEVEGGGGSGSARVSFRTPRSSHGSGAKDRESRRSAASEGQKEDSDEGKDSVGAMEGPTPSTPLGGESGRQSTHRSDATELLPGKDYDWEEHDDGGGRLFYFNVESGTSTWELPQEGRLWRLDGTVEVLGEAQEDPKNWEVVDDGQGRMYYFNKVLQQSFWEKPKCIIEAEKAAGVEGSDWSVMFDEEGNQFFYNALTGESRWGPPTPKK